VVEHQPGVPPGSSGPERIKRLIGGLRGAFPDLTCEIQHLVADGDLVWGHFRARGTHAGPFFNVSPTGKPIAGIDAAAAVPNAMVFHAGTVKRDGQIVTSGGRVLSVVGRGPTHRAAIDVAYQATSLVKFDGMQFRRDIGRKALQHL